MRWRQMARRAFYLSTRPKHAQSRASARSQISYGRRHILCSLSQPNQSQIARMHAYDGDCLLACFRRSRTELSDEPKPMPMHDDAEDLQVRRKFS